MKVTCKYCGSVMSDRDEHCPNCGGINHDILRCDDYQPITIRELREFCENRNISLSSIRVCIGYNCPDASFSGIYEEGGFCTVFANKENGTQKKLYEGYDEAYAVSVIYEIIRSNIEGRKVDLRKKSTHTHEHDNKKVPKKKMNLAVLIIAVVIAVNLFSMLYSLAQSGLRIYQEDKYDTGYFLIADIYYYHNNSGWYFWNDDTSEWEIYYGDFQNYQKYYVTYHEIYEIFGDAMNGDFTNE